jgi:hypothetical protein
MNVFSVVGFFILQQSFQLSLCLLHLFSDLVLLDRAQVELTLVLCLGWRIQSLQLQELALLLEVLLNLVLLFTMVSEILEIDGFTY